MLPSKTKSMLEAWLEQLPKLIKVVTPENLTVPRDPDSLIRWTFAIRFSQFEGVVGELMVKSNNSNPVIHGKSRGYEASGELW